MRIAVVIPGIMGSALYYPQPSGDRHVIWGENFAGNYKRLLSNPTILAWSGNQASTELLESIYLSRAIPFAKVRLWQRLLEHLRNHAEFGRPERTVKAAYDWRGSLLDSAIGLVERIDAHIEGRLSAAPASDVRLSVLTHSMGGVLLRCAIGLGLLDVQRVERIVHIGTPLAGAPDAFRAAYGDPGLPLLREMNHLIRGKRTHQFWQHLQRCVRTFPSLYELMPHPGQNFLVFSPARRENPFDPRFTSYLPTEHLQGARDVQAALQEAERRLFAAGTAVYTIFTENHSQRMTDLDYRVRAIAAPDPEYEILEAGASTRQGDGTVPVESARGSHQTCRWKPLLNVTHASMCNEKKVIQVLETIL
jgi:hypothetical protein